MIAGQVTKEQWKRFVQEGALDTSRISRRIAASWYQCRKSGVDPYNGKGILRLQSGDLQKKREENKRLIEIAIPFMQKLAQMYAQSNMIILLIDRDGYVLKLMGQAKARALATHINFTEGVKWTEREVGTNAIGTALSTGEAITVNGPEHFSLASQSWGCSASPIRDENGDVLGILDISSPSAAGYHEHLLGTVVSAAYAIEHKWQQLIKEEEIALMHHALECLGKQETSFLVADRHGSIVYLSPQAKANLNASRGTSINDLPFSAAKIPVYSTDGGQVIGSYAAVPVKEGKPHGTGWPRTFSFKGVIGTSSTFKEVLEKAEKASGTNVTVHISGETGTGKEVMARSIHESHAGPNAPFIAINCGAVPVNLLESELFGYARGAFTGAKKEGAPGKIVQADGGTLFLDEIGEVPAAMQVALLRVLQEKEVTPVGGDKTRRVHFRLITASNRPLGEQVQNGTFREDLYYRIYVYAIHLPPLRRRREDIPALVHYYFHQNGRPFTWTEEAIQVLQRQEWKGNIRELFNVLEGLYVEFQEETPAPHQIEAYMQQISPECEERPPAPSLSVREQMEKDYLEKALRQHGGKASLAAEQLGIPRSSFYRKLVKYKLS
ncbi:sigma-54-dependent Fis family transcriptional regulator [Sinobaca sp. H24]|uniref:sigma-54-dependent Fis family transcriptional regulator n=1 Tax=Sinobaca sp. H24 TaxID=2923376 RepID=UPI00207A078A|nr:sigma-54-dependent Fis family transcriptional regulator [Sinobaca sp. H24]